MCQKGWFFCGVIAAGDHGVKAQGDGWLMTVTLIEGEYLSPTEECSFANPYVVFTCSGKRRTSSVKLRTLNPHWRGIVSVPTLSSLSYSCQTFQLLHWLPTCFFLSEAFHSLKFQFWGLMLFPTSYMQAWHAYHIPLWTLKQLVHVFRLWLNFTPCFETVGQVMFSGWCELPRCSRFMFLAIFAMLSSCLIEILFFSV